MLRVFADAGLQVQRSLVDGVYDLTFPLPADEADTALGTYRDTVAVRERSADVASMRPVLMPASVAVIGASGELLLLGADDPGNFVFARLLAVRTVQRGHFFVRSLIEKFAFFHK